MKVAVVRGGRSPEREFSLRSGYHVASAVKHLGHEVAELDVDEQLSRRLSECEVAFLALHGRDGEDGTIQRVLEALAIPYTGSDPLACQLCFDKPVAKGLLERAGVSTPPAYVVSEEAVRQMGAGVALRAGAERLGFPIVVKPAAQGSALGLAVVEEGPALSAAVMSAFSYGDRVVLERFVPGRELAVTLLGPSLDPLPVVEIQPKGRVFDFESRVTPGGAEYKCPAQLKEEELDLVVRVASVAASTLLVRDFARLDLILADDGVCYFLDCKTCPGLTESSLVPLAVEGAGLTFEQFVERLLEAALDRPTRP